MIAAQMQFGKQRVVIYSEVPCKDMSIQIMLRLIIMHSYLGKTEMEALVLPT